MTTTASPPRSSWRDAALVLGAAAAVRAAFFLFYRTSPFFEAPLLDSAFHQGLAQAIAAGDWSAGAPYFRPPLYPWLLGLLQMVGGAGPWVGRLANAAAGCALSVIVLETGVRLGLSRRLRVGAALATALYAPELFLEGELLGEPLATALAAGGLLAVLAGWIAAPAGSVRPWVIGALLWAGAALARGPLLLLPALALGLALAAPGARARRTTGVLLAALALWAGPAALMASHGAGWRFPATQGGVNFYLGNHPEADGRGVDAPWAEPAGWLDFAEASVRTASARAGRDLGPVGASQFWTREGLAFWQDDPLGAAGLTLRKGLYLIHGYETPNNRSLYAARQDVPWLYALLWSVPGLYWPTGLLIPLAVVGVGRVRRCRNWLPVVLFAGVTLLPLVFFFVCARFRVPAIPALALLAAVGVGSLRRGRWMNWVLFAGIYALVNLPWPGAVESDPARDHLARGEAALNAGRSAEARTSYLETLRLDPSEGRARLGLAVAAEGEGDLERALGEVETAAALTPDHWEVEAAWARILDRLGRHSDATPHLQRAVEIYPENPSLWGRLGLTLEVTARHREARAALEEATRLGSDEPEVWNSAGRYRLIARDRSGALAAWNRALELDSNHYKALANRGLYYAQEGDGPAAERDLEAALAAAPDPGAADRVREALHLVRSRLP